MRLAAFAGSLGLVFGGAWGVGVLTGPGPATPSSVPDPVGMAGEMAGTSGMAGMSGTAGMSGMAGRRSGPDDDSIAADEGDPDVGTDGLASSAQGWILAPATTVFTAGAPADLVFSVLDDGGRAVTSFAGGTHPRLVVVRRDAAQFQAADATATPDGGWRVPLRLPTPGVYRAFADLGGPVLGVDLFVAGEFTPVVPPPSRSTVVDGLQVRLDGDLVPHQPSQLFATISRAGAPVTDLEPFGDGFGRLVALRQGDLAYATAGPGDGAAPPPAAQARSGPAVAFTTLVPSAGTYHLFLQFREADAVHTAEFTVVTRSGP